MNSNNYRPYSSSEDSEEEVVVYEDDRLVIVIVLVSSFPIDTVLKVKVCKLIISRINKKAPIPFHNFEYFFDKFFFEV